jgi:hypothetical protein
MTCATGWTRRRLRLAVVLAVVPAVVLAVGATGRLAAQEPAAGGRDGVDGSPRRAWPEAAMTTGAASEPAGNPHARRRRIAGWALVGTYGATVLGAAAMGDALLQTTAVPVVGPWLTIGVISTSAGKFSFQPGARPLLMASGVAQGALVVTWARALTAERRWAREAGGAAGAAGANGAVAGGAVAGGAVAGTGPRVVLGPTADLRGAVFSVRF